MGRSIFDFTAFCAFLCASATLFAAPGASVTMNPRDEGGARISVGSTRLVVGTRFTVHSPEQSM